MDQYKRTDIWIVFCRPNSSAEWLADNAFFSKSEAEADIEELKSDRAFKDFETRIEICQLIENKHLICQPIIDYGQEENK